MLQERKEVPMQSRVAAVQTASAESRTAELVWTTGARVLRADWWTGEKYTEELSLDSAAVRMERMQLGAPLLDAHGTWSVEDVIGVVEKAWLEPGAGRAIVRFSKRADVEPILADVVDGILRNVSVGYFVHQYRDVTEKGDVMRRLLAIDWEPAELSLVPVGADPKAGVREQPRKVSCVIELPDAVRLFEAEQTAERQMRDREYRSVLSRARVINL
jgi:hypothetical protein